MVSTGWLERMREDHRKVLERLAQLAPETPHGTRPPVPAVREFVDFLAGQFETHMAAEDDALFPIVLRTLPAVTDTLAPLQLEHRELRTMLQALRELLDTPAGKVRDEQIAIQMADLAELLRIHIRKEERLVFQVAERVLRPGELERLVSGRTTGTGPEPDPPNPTRSL
jgi:hemerythrin-like domain-containing protein